MKLAFSPYGHTGAIAPFNRLFQTSFNPCLQDSLDGADALILWGGTDVHPSFYKEKAHRKTQTSHLSDIPIRDQVEWHLMREAYKRGLPIIGVCRGAQFLCVFAGGSLIQDVTNHNTGHDITTHAGKTYYAPADHHQMMLVDGVADYQLLAWSEKRSTHYENGDEQAIQLQQTVDPEVVYFPKVKGFAIQPHPEWGPTGTEFNNWIVEELNELF